MLLHSISFAALFIAVNSDIISIGNNNKQLREFDTASGLVVGSYDGHDATVVQHDYSPNGKIMASVTYSNYLYLFDTSTYAMIHPPIKFVGGVLSPCVAVSSNGTVAVVGGQYVYQYDIATGKLLTSTALGSVINVRGLAYSPDGKQFTTVETDGSTPNNYGNARQFDSSTGNLIRFLPSICINGLLMVAYSPNGLYFGVSAGSSLDEYVHVFEVSTGNLYRKFTDPIGPYGDMRCIAFSPDSKSVIEGGADRTLRQYDLQSGKMITRTASTNGDWIQGCAFSADGAKIAFTENSNHWARIIDSSTGKAVGTVRDGSTPYAVKYRPH